MPKKLDHRKEAEAHEELKGFDIKVDPFGKMESNLPIEKINEFLNKNIDDRRLSHLKEEE